MPPPGALSGERYPHGTGLACAALPPSPQQLCPGPRVLQEGQKDHSAEIYRKATSLSRVVEIQLQNPKLLGGGGDRVAVIL